MPMRPFRNVQAVFRRPPCPLPRTPVAHEGLSAPQPEVHAGVCRGLARESLKDPYKLGAQLGAFISRDKVHLVAMTGPCFRGDGEAGLAPTDEGRFETVTCTSYEQLNGYRWLKSLDIGFDRRKPAHRLASPGTGHQGH